MLHELPPYLLRYIVGFCPDTPWAVSCLHRVNSTLRQVFSAGAIATEGGLAEIHLTHRKYDPWLHPLYGPRTTALTTRTGIIGVARILRDAPWLTRLVLANYTPITREQTSEYIRRIAQCTQLTDLTLYNDLWTTNGMLAGIIWGCRRVTKLTISGSVRQLDDDSLGAIVAGYPELTELSISDWARLENLMPIARLSHLTRLNVSGCQVVCDVVVEAIAQGCPQLRDVSMACCHSITDAAIIALTQSAHQITTLDLWNCSQTTDESIKQIAERYPQITSLKLSPRTDAAVIAVARGCPRLHQFHANRSIRRHLTDAAVIALAHGCPRLRNVNISFWKQITDAAIVVLAQKCPELTQVTLSHCFLLTDVAVIALHRGCPRLTGMFMGPNARISYETQNLIRRPPTA